MALGHGAAVPAAHPWSAPVCRRQCQPVSAALHSAQGGRRLWGLRARDSGLETPSWEHLAEESPAQAQIPLRVGGGQAMSLGQPKALCPGQFHIPTWPSPCSVWPLHTHRPCSENPAHSPDVCRAIPSFSAVKGADPEARCCVTLGKQLSLSLSLILSSSIAGERKTDFSDSSSSFHL